MVSFIAAFKKKCTRMIDDFTRDDREAIGVGDEFPYLKADRSLGCYFVMLCELFGEPGERSEKEKEILWDVGESLNRHSTAYYQGMNLVGRETYGEIWKPQEDAKRSMSDYSAGMLRLLDCIKSRKEACDSAMATASYTEAARADARVINGAEFKNTHDILMENMRIQQNRMRTHATDTMLGYRGTL